MTSYKKINDPTKWLVNTNANKLFSEEIKWYFQVVMYFYKNILLEVF